MSMLKWTGLEQKLVQKADGGHRPLSNQNTCFKFVRVSAGRLNL